MKTLSSKDILSALTTGLTTGIIAWLILVFLGRSLPFGIPTVVLLPLVPLLWMAGVQLGYFLAFIARPFEQFGRFAAIGFANAMVDYGVLYLLIALTGQATDGFYAIFKTISFSVATVHSYAWNKYWAFESGKKASSSREVLSFFVVSAASLVVNVVSAYLIVKIGPLGGLNVKEWAGVGAVGGSFVALIFNFFGYKLFVFRQ